MKIPFFGNDREYAKYENLFHQTGQQVWKTGQYLNGPWVKEFEISLAKSCQRKFALTLGSCTDALTFALQSLGLDDGSEVLVTNFSFLSSATSILRANLIPVFCDVDPKTMMINEKNLEEKITDRTKVVLAVSLFGSLAPLNRIEKFCKKHNFILIEDAAQSFGASLKQRAAGSFGKASAISFDPTKILHGTGAGGALLTDDKELYRFSKTLRLHGRDEEGHFVRMGHKSLLPSHDAAIMNKKLKDLPSWIRRRKEIATKYNETIHKLKFCQPQFIDEDISPTYHKFVIRCHDPQTRQELRNFLEGRGITTRVHYGRPINEEEVFKQNKDKTPHAKTLCQEILSLPLFHEMSDEEVQYVCACLQDFQTL